MVGKFPQLFSTKLGRPSGWIALKSLLVVLLLYSWQPIKLSYRLPSNDYSMSYWSKVSKEKDSQAEIGKAAQPRLSGKMPPCSAKQHNVTEQDLF